MVRNQQLSTKVRLKVPGFTLVELAIVLLVMGMIAGAIFKGQDLIESARIRSILNDFNRFRLAVVMYQETYGMLPGDDNHASAHFGGEVTNGNGNGIINYEEEQTFWQHLNKSGQLSSANPPTSKLGGRYKVVYQPTPQWPGHWLQLGKENGSTLEGILTPKQAQLLKSKAEDNGNLNPTQGAIRFMEGAGVPKGQCVQGDHLNLEVDAPVCVVLAAF